MDLSFQFHSVLSRIDAGTRKEKGKLLSIFFLSPFFHSQKYKSMGVFFWRGWGRHFKIKLIKRENKPFLPLAKLEVVLTKCRFTWSYLFVQYLMILGSDLGLDPSSFFSMPNFHRVLLRLRWF